MQLAFSVTLLRIALGFFCERYLVYHKQPEILICILLRNMNKKVCSAYVFMDRFRMIDFIVVLILVY